MIQKIWRTNLNHPWLSLSILILVIVLSAFAIALNLTPNNAPKVYLPQDRPTVVYHEMLKKVFPQSDITVGIFKPPNILSKDFLNKIDQLSTDMKALSLVDDVYSLTTAKHIEPTEEGFAINPLINIDEFDEHPVSYWQDRLLNDRFAERQIVNRSLTETTIIILPKDADDTLKRLEILNSFMQMVESNGLQPYFIGTAGLLPQDTAQFTLIKKDNMRLIPILLLVVFVLVYFLYRSWTLLLFTILILLATVLSSVALYALFDKPFTSISSVTPSLLMALVTALLIHIYNFIYTGAKKGLSHINNIISAIDKLAKPTLFIIITTAAGLLSLSLSPVPTVSSFGWISAIGIILFYLITILTLPGLLARWGQLTIVQNKKNKKSIIDSLMIHANHLSLRRPGLVILGVTILCTAAVYQMPKIHVETNFLKFFDENHPINVNTKHIDENYFGTATALVAFESEKIDSFKDANFLKKIKQVHIWLDKQPEVSRTTSIVDFIEVMHMSFHGGKKSYEKIPDSSALINEYIFIYGEDDIYDFVNHDFNLAQLTINTDAHNVNDGEQFLFRLENFLNSINWGSSVSWKINGHLKILAEQENLLMEGQLKSIAGAVLLIFIFLVIATRSFSGGLMCLFPNFAPVLSVFGVMGFLGIWLNMGTVLVASVVTGIAVDDTIHFFYSYRRLREKGTGVSWALARTTRETGSAITATTFILSAQFLLLTNSEFIPLSNFGLLAFVGLISAWVFDLLLLPALIIVINRKFKFSI